MQNARSFLGRWVAVALVIVWLFALSGCAGSSDSGGGMIGGGTYSGKTYSAAGFDLAASQAGTVSLHVAANGKVSGSLTIAAKSAAATPNVSPGTYNFQGSFTNTAGAFQAAFSSPANSSLSGTLPAPPSTDGGTFTLSLSGTSYGPFPFQPVTTTAGYKADVIGLLPGGDYSAPSGINDSGVVVGSASTATNTRAFIWDKTHGLKDLGTAGGSNAGADDIDNAGTIAGHFKPLSNNQISYCFSGTNAGIHDIGLPPGFEFLAVEGITDAGKIVMLAGHFTNNGTVGSSFLYDGQHFTEIGIGGDSEALGCSKSGIIYGELIEPTGPLKQFWKYSGGTSTAIPASKLGNVSFLASVRGLGVGPAGQILSKRKDTNSAAIFSEAGAVLNDLGVSGSVVAMNSHGTAVGNFGGGGGSFVWTSTGGVKNLDGLIDSSAGLTILQVMGINASGQIIARAKSTHLQTGVSGVAVLLTPQ